MRQHENNPSIYVLDSSPEVVSRYTSVGCYPLFYITDDSGVLCPGCVGDEIDQCCDEASGGWHVVGADVNYENTSLYCDHCGERIESAYADDDLTNE
jgi:hypothetical protein